MWLILKILAFSWISSKLLGLLWFLAQTMMLMMLDNCMVYTKKIHILRRVTRCWMEAIKKDNIAVNFTVIMDI